MAVPIPDPECGPMRRAAVFALVVVSLLGALAIASYGQSRRRRVGKPSSEPIPAGPPSRGAPAPGDDGDMVSLEGALVEVPVVVSDRSGHYVPQLRQQDFRVL